MSHFYLDPLIQFVANRTGIQINAQHLDGLQRFVERRMKSLGLSSVDRYCDLCAQGEGRSGASGGGTDSVGQQEWKYLVDYLTVGESYFFRDERQFSLLRRHIFPEIIQQKRQAHLVSRTCSKLSMRVWSAGCSTGEEVYSLAAMLQDLIPDWSSWDIQVIGTDINLDAIEKARTGLYGNWSFRQPNSEFKQQHMTWSRQGWQVNDGLKKMTRFYGLNLVTDPFPDQRYSLCDVDLIICRNVFIYFRKSAIAQVLRKFYASLAPQRYLVTGHTELQGQDIGHFKIISFPESVVYQRVAGHGVTYPSATMASSRPKQDSRAASVTRLPSSRLLYAPGLTTDTPVTPPANLSNHSEPSESSEPSEPANHAAALPAAPLPAAPLPAATDNKRKLITPSTSASTRRLTQKLAKKLTHQPQSKSQSSNGAIAPTEAPTEALYRTYLITAREHANLGQYDQAEAICQQAIQIQPFSIEPYYILTHIAEEQGQVDRAKTWLKRIIYLEPHYVPAYLELAIIYEQEANLRRSTKYFQSALALLRQLPPDSELDFQGRATVAELIRLIEQHGVF